MKKENILWNILNTIFLVVFNIFFFALNGTNNVASVWLSYSFIHFAYIMLLLTPKFIRAGKSSAVFGFSIYYISSIYFLIELVTGITFIIIAPEIITTSLLVQVSIAMLYSLILIALLIANERTADAEEARTPQIAFIKEASMKIAELSENVKDPEIKKQLEQIYDTFYSSPIKSHKDLIDKEEVLLAMLSELEALLNMEDKENIMAKINVVATKINERNRLLKTYN